jgi:hypothetical protein
MENVRTVKLDPQEHQDVVEGLAEPCRVLTQDVSTCLILCDANDRVYGSNGCDFTVDLKGEIDRGRVSRVSKIIIPKLPTINPNNNRIIIRHALDGGTPISFTLPYGWMNQVSLVNELKLAFDTACVGLPDTFAVSYNALTHVISITSNGGHLWFFSDSCSFIVRGIDVAGFRGLSATLDPAVVGSVTRYSSSASFVYSRYVTLHSNALNRYVRTPSRTSSGDLSIIAAISVVDDMNSSDFDTSGLFTGSSVTELTLEDAPRNSFNLKYGVLRYIDFSVRDQFGLPIYESINISPSLNNTFNCVVWLSIDL